MGSEDSGEILSVIPDSEHVSDPSVSTHVARLINKFGEPLPSDAKSLWLAAGQGHAEIRLARALGLNPADATFVDQQFTPLAKSNIAGQFPEARIIDADLFEFLEKTPETNFALVSALGGEFIFERPEAMQRFITLLPRVMRQGGIVAIAPFVGQQDPSEAWRQHGFEPLSPQTTFRSPGVAGTMMYVLRPKARAKAA